MFRIERIAGGFGQLAEGANRQAPPLPHGEISKVSRIKEGARAHMNATNDVTKQIESSPSHSEYEYEQSGLRNRSYGLGVELWRKICFSGIQ